MPQNSYICAIDYDTMAQVSMTVRMDSGLKEAFDSLCSQFGMSSNTAMVVFAKAVVQRGKIPFEIRGDRAESIEENDGLKAFKAIRAMAEAGAFPDMTLEDINEEIRQARRER